MYTLKTDGVVMRLIHNHLDNVAKVIQLAIQFSLFIAEIEVTNYNSK